MIRLYIWFAVIAVVLVALAVRWEESSQTDKILMFVVLALAGARIGMVLREQKKK